MNEQAIDLNADMGEYAGEAQQAVEAGLMPLVSSCSIACGGHAGDKITMRATARLAKEHGVSIGAHPSYPDRNGFGRRRFEIAPDALLASLQEQISALRDVLYAERMPLAHVKPHGALYNEAAKDAALAALVVEAAGDVVIVGPPDSELEAAARAAAKRFAAEGFVDRLYEASGALTPRSRPGAIIGDIDLRARQAVAIARGEKFPAVDGALRLSVATLCIHGDSPGAVQTAKAVRTALEEAGFAIRSFA